MFLVITVIKMSIRIILLLDNCLDRIVETDPGRIALIWEKDEPCQQEYITYQYVISDIVFSNYFFNYYRQLKDMTCQIANVLKSQGVKKGDRVAIYMPVSLEAAATMLACTRIGAVHR